MNNLRQHLQHYFLTNYGYLYISLLVVAALERTVTLSPHAWSQYFITLGLLLLAYSPLILFSFYQERLRNSFPAIYYYAAWSGVVIATALLAHIFLQAIPGIYQTYIGRTDYTITLGLFTILLAAALILQELIRRRSRKLNKISFNKGLYAIVILIALIIPFVTLEGISVAGYLIAVLQVLTLLSLVFGLHILHDKLLVPLLERRGIVIYIVAAAGFIALISPWAGQLAQYILLAGGAIALSMHVPPAFVDLYPVAGLVVILYSLPIAILLRWYRQSTLINELKKQQTETELDLLKQQINPHFFFNTLNNLYALSLQKSDKTPDVVLQLSDLMRYVIYKGQEKRVAAQEEVAYLEDYLSLQKIRMAHRVDIHFDSEIAEGAMSLPPLLLIIPIENAFKHGIEPLEEKGELSISLRVEENSFTFSCTNTYIPAQAGTEGIGLQNLRRRLELLFPQSHVLKITPENDTFTLKIQVWELQPYVHS